ncbi:type II toxin-antitoxin system RelE/ParE family toxin [Kosakonia oryzae]|uniref:type II toxin-antitoxin system RelE/ParE family toxin n=1 Tax=Kosakonia oryzae TaxID=497725 RepID=UPI001D085702|nr:type II toxin-antitoxin system RelE/ParE family toxin [Kosakonia oryzae]UDJ83821.1 type II toxin-antitoxin system RelE/ParE family toxin [Kosakonia oryzae]
MAAYILTEEAQRDLREIRDYTFRNFGKQQSRDYLANMRQMLEKIAGMPTMGLKREEELGAGVYSFPCDSHMIYYIVARQGIAVLAVLHQSRVPVHHLAERLSKSF